MTLQVKIDFFGDHRCSLGESPIWDAENVCLWWVDSTEARICSATTDGRLRTEWRFNQKIGSIGLASGGLIAAMADGFYHVSGSSGEATLIALLSDPPADMRLNDGKVDRVGRYLCGPTQMTETARGPIVQLDARGNIRTIVEDIRITNSICFSPDGSFVYLADSLDGVIRRYSYDNATGNLGEREDFIDVRQFGSASDGATVDAQGNIWIALVLDQAIACVGSDGKLIAKFDVPIPYPSCPAIGGQDMDVLFVTSISNSGHKLVTNHPEGGRILAIRGHGMTGVNEQHYG